MNALVPWNTSYLDIFFDFVKNAIGVAVIIGVLIFAAIIGLWIIRAVVRRFM